MTGPAPLLLDTICPRCGTQMNRAIDFDKPGDLPEAGDFALCYGCADWAVFTKNRTLRLPTVFEAAEIAETPSLVRAAARLRAVKEEKSRGVARPKSTREETPPRAPTRGAKPH